MSRYGKSPVPFPKGIEIKQTKNQVDVKGPKGELSLEMASGIDLTIGENQLTVALSNGSSVSGAMHGLYRSLINNMIEGVSKGFEKKLSLIGVGYRASVSGSELDVQVGFSHPTKLKIPEGITVTVEKATTIKVAGTNKQAVGEFAARIRRLRPPEPYKGKGIRYVGEYVRKKAGKAAKGK